MGWQVTTIDIADPMQTQDSIKCNRKWQWTQWKLLGHLSITTPIIHIMD